MKIVVCLHDYLPRHPGGTEIHAHEVARELARRGHEVTALFTERDLAARDGEVREGRLDGVRTLEVVHQREYADVRESFEEPRSLALFTRLVGELAPDVVHFQHLAVWGSRVLPAARAAGARTVVTLNDYWLLCDIATLLRPDGELCTDGLRGACTSCLRRHPLLAERWSEPDAEARWRAAARARFERHRADFAAADVVVAPSRFLARQFEAAGFRRAEDCEILLYGYPGTLHPPRRRDPSRKLRVGFVGGIYPSKGVHVLVKAFRHLVGEPVTLRVHGHLDWFPDYAAELRREAEGLDVTFAGGFAREAAEGVLSNLDLLVVPSIWYENMPITIYEARRHGIPVVVTNLGGMAEAVEHGVTGLTFPRGDDVALAERIRSLVRDPVLYDRLAAARPRIVRLDEVVDRLERLYSGSR